jgi:hypothetical protein
MVAAAILADPKGHSGRGVKRGRAPSVLAGDQGRRRVEIGAQRLAAAGSATPAAPKCTLECPLNKFMATQLEPIVAKDEEELLTEDHEAPDSPIREGPWPWERGGAASIPPFQSVNYRPVRRWLQIDDEINAALDKASSDGRRGRNTTGVRAWFAFCKDIIGTSPDRPLDPNSPLWVRLEEEWLRRRFHVAKHAPVAQCNKGITIKFAYHLLLNPITQRRRCFKTHDGL